MKSSSVHSTAGSGSRKKLLHACRIVLLSTSLIVIFTLILILSALLLALGTRAGTRTVILKGLEFYNESIPGHVSVDGITGTFFSTIRLNGIHINDKKGGSLISCGQLEIRIHIPEILIKSVRVDNLTIHDAAVHLRTGGNGNSTFKDLAPREQYGGEDEAEGPVSDVISLPFRLSVGRMKLTDIAVHKWEKGKSTELASVVELVIAGQWEGPDAEAEIISLSGMVAPADLSIEKAVLDAEWNGRRASIIKGEVTTNHGTAHMEKTTFDPFRMHGELKAAVSIKHDFVKRYAGIPISEDLNLDIHFSGGPDDLKGEIEATSGSASLEIRAQGRLKPDPKFGIRYELRNADPEKLGLKFQGLLGGSGSIEISSIDGQPAVSGDFTCSDCTVEKIRLDSAHINGSWSSEEASADVSVSASDSNLHAAGRMNRGEEINVEWKLKSDSTAEISRALLNTAVSGRLAADGNCTGSLKNPVCTLSLKASSVETAGVRIEKLHADSYLAFKDNSPWFKADIKMDNISTGNVNASRINAEISGTPLEIDARLHAAGNGDVHGRADLNVKPGSSTEIRVNKLHADVKGARVHLLNPADILVGEDGLEIRNLDAAIDDSSIRMNGRYAFNDSSRFELKVRNLDLSLLNSFIENVKLAGILDAAGSITGKPEYPVINVAMNAHDLAYKDIYIGNVSLKSGYSGRTAEIDLRIKGSGGSTAQISSILPVRISLNPFAAELLRRSGIEAEWSLNNITDSQLRQFTDLTGVDEFMISGSGSLGGTLSAPDISVALSGMVSPASLKKPVSFSLNSSYRDMNIRMEGRIEQTEIYADGRFEPEGSSLIRAGIRNFNLKELNRHLQGHELGGTASASASFRGTLENPGINLNISIQDLVYGGKHIGNIDLEAAYEREKVGFSLSMKDGDKSIASVNAEVPVEVNLKPFSAEWKKERNHRIKWIVKGIDDEKIKAFVPIGNDARFLLSSTCNISGTGIAPVADLVARAELHIPEYGKLPVVLRIEVSPERQSVRLETPRPGPLQMKVQMNLRADIAAIAAGEMKIKDVPVSGLIDIKPFSLKATEPFLPGMVYDPEGMADSKLSFDGTIGRPGVRGRLRIRKGSLSILHMSDPLEGIELDISTADDMVKLERLVFRNGRGESRAEGWMDISSTENLKGHLSLNLHNFPVEIAGIPRMTVNTSSETSIKIDKEKASIRTQLSESSVEVSVKSPKAPLEIPGNSNIVIVEGGPLSGESGRDIPDRDSRPLVLVLELKSPLLVKGPLVDMSFEGGVRTSTEAGRATFTGSFTSDSGSFEFLGNTFRVDRAFIGFQKGRGSEPYINITANSELPDAMVTIRISGPAGKPGLVFSSVPPMPQYQIFTLLVTGQIDTTEENRGQVAAKAANLGTGIVALQYPELQQALSTRTGIDRASVSFGETAEEPILSVGKRITRSIFVQTSYHHNAPEDTNRAEGRVEFILVPHWMLETGYGDASVGSVDIFWHNTFGGPEQNKAESGEEEPRKTAE